MPPPRCLHAVPLRAIDSALPSRSSRYISASSTHAFSTSSQSHYPSPGAGGPAKGVTSLRLKKKGPPQRTAKPPEPGERRALRKRIVLSNTNALPVRNIAPLTVETLDKSAIYTLPPEVIDQLRAVEAFKPKQGWSFFQTPAVLMRDEARALGADMDAISGKAIASPESAGNEAAQKTPAKTTARTSRKVVAGEKGSGKSVLLLQAMAMAFQRGWIVINLPEGRELTNGHTAFSPIHGTSPTQYAQPTYTAKLLKQILVANKAVLDKLNLTEKPKLAFPVRDNISLAGLLELGIDDPDRAWPIFQVFWQEATKANSSIDTGKVGERPPVLMCLDNMAHVMVESKYQVLNEAGKLVSVHSHDLALIKYFCNHLSGSAVLPNGGLVLAATSASDAPKVEAMDVGIAIAETQQILASGSPSSQSSYSTPYTRTQALSPDKDPSPTALSNFHSPFAPIDTRVLESLKNVQVVRLAGLNQGEATALMRYWTRSGVHRGTVLPWLVDEAKGLSGGAIIGQLERAVVREVQREHAAIEGEAGGKKIRVH